MTVDEERGLPVPDVGEVGNPSLITQILKVLKDKLTVHLQNIIISW